MLTSTRSMSIPLLMNVEGTNKGDDSTPCYRSRWVAQRYRRAWVEAIFSATPNIETVRLLLADAASRIKEVGPLSEVCVMVIDIKRAYFYAPAQKDIFVRLPPEDPRAKDPNVCGRLLKSLYGTRDAGANWHLAYSAFLKDPNCAGIDEPMPLYRGRAIT